MPIRYKLYKNHLTDGEDKYAARISLSGDSIDLDTMAERIVSMGTTVRKADVLAVLENTCQACEEFLLDGRRVNLGGVFDIYPRLVGNFDSISDVYDPARHTLEVGSSPGSRIRNIIKKDGTVEKHESTVPKPAPQEYIDVTSGTANDPITPNSIGVLNGHRLKYDSEAADEGIYFVDNVGAATKVTIIQNNTDRKLVFQNPVLSGPESPYHAEVRKRFTPEGELRVGRLDADLTPTA